MVEVILQFIQWCSIHYGFGIIARHHFSTHTMLFVCHQVIVVLENFYSISKKKTCFWYKVNVILYLILVDRVIFRYNDYISYMQIYMSIGRVFCDIIRCRFQSIIFFFILLKLKQDFQDGQFKCCYLLLPQCNQFSMICKHLAAYQAYPFFSDWSFYVNLLLRIFKVRLEL